MSALQSYFTTDILIFVRDTLSDELYIATIFFTEVFVTVSVMQGLPTCFYRKHSSQLQVYRSYTG